MIAYCPTCKVDSIVNDSGVCSWCSTATGVKKPSTRRGGAGPGPRWLTEPQLRAAHQAHVDGESLNSIGKRLLAETRYESLYGVVGALSGEYRRRGWFVRDRIDACVAASTIHGRARRKNRDPEYKRELRRKSGLLLDRPRCSALTIHGQQCLVRAMRDADTCYTHAHADHLERMLSVRKPRKRVWLAKALRADELRADGLTWREIAELLGYASAGSAHSMARQARAAVAETAAA